MFERHWVGHPFPFNVDTPFSCGLRNILPLVLTENCMS